MRFFPFHPAQDRDSELAFSYRYTMVRSILRSVGLTSWTRYRTRHQNGKRENATCSLGLNSLISSSFGSSCIMSWGSSRPHLYVAPVPPTFEPALFTMNELQISKTI